MNAKLLIYKSLILIFIIGIAFFCITQKKCSENDQLATPTKLSFEEIDMLVAGNDKQTLINTAINLMDNNTLPYSAFAANYLLIKPVNHIADEYKIETWYKKLQTHKQIKQLLKKGVILNLPYSNLKKISFYLKNGDFTYLKKRLSTFLSTPTRKRISIEPKDYEPFSYSINFNSHTGNSPILNQYSNRVGSAYWALEDSLNFDYIYAPLTLRPITDSIKKHEKLFFYTTASFINKNGEPIGLNYSNGIEKNGIPVNTWNGIIKIENGCCEILSKNNCLINFQNYYQLLNTTRIKGNDLIQLPLLIENGKQTFKFNNTAFNFREHRFLCFVSDSLKRDYILLVNFEKAALLREHLHALHTASINQKYKIKTCLLFDVGGNDLLHVYKSGNQIRRETRAGIPVEKANNLLVVTFKNQNIHHESN